MSIKRYALCLIALMVMLCACGRPSSFSSGAEATASAPEDVGGVIHRLTAEEAKATMDFWGAGSYILLDVRNQDEYDNAHIESAILIPAHELAARAESEIPDKDSFIFIYCQSGRRSAIAAETLLGMGYSTLFDFGGISDWPYEVVR